MLQMTEGIHELRGNNCKVFPGVHVIRSCAQEVAAIRRQKMKREIGFWTEMHCGHEIDRVVFSTSQTRNKAVHIHKL
jgi:hypothetical protein